MSLPDGLIYDCLNLALSTIFHVLGAFMAISTLGEIAIHWNWKRCTFFNSLSLCAMGMYLFHQQIVYVTMWLFNGKLPPIPHAIINFGFATVVSWGMTLILLKFRFTSLLIGTKKQVTSSKQIGIDNER